MLLIKIKNNLYFSNNCFLASREDFRDLESLRPSDDAVNVRLTTPAVATMLNTDNIAFSR